MHVTVCVCECLSVCAVFVCACVCIWKNVCAFVVMYLHISLGMMLSISARAVIYHSPSRTDLTTLVSGDKSHCAICSVWCAHSHHIRHNDQIACATHTYCHNRQAIQRQDLAKVNCVHKQNIKTDMAFSIKASIVCSVITPGALSRFRSMIGVFHMGHWYTLQLTFVFFRNWNSTTSFSKYIYLHISRTHHCNLAPDESLAWHHLALCTVSDGNLCIRDKVLDYRTLRPWMDQDNPVHSC